MKINKLNISYSTTVQMRQFEPLNIFVSAEVQVDPGEHIDTVFKKVFKQLQDQVEEQAKMKKIARKSNYDDELEKTI